MSEPVLCQDCDKELSEEKGELAHGCLDCHGSPQSEKLFWLRKELESLRTQLAEAQKTIAENTPFKNYVETMYELESLRTQLKEAKNTVRNLLAGMDESCCTCGADDWPNGQVDTCYYHEAREFLSKYPENKESNT